MVILDMENVPSLSNDHKILLKVAFYGTFSEESLFKLPSANFVPHRQT